VIDFAQWLTTTENILEYAEWASAVPARESAAEQFSLLRDDENIRTYFQFALETGNPTFPFGHPIQGRYLDEALTPALEALANGTLTAEAADAQLVEAADRMMDEWLETAPPDVVELWAQPPADWPGPKYPDWTIRRPMP
jgi:ABC-type glycerol-3-phosphate transport system substrate-binding protein